MRTVPKTKRGPSRRLAARTALSALCALAAVLVLAASSASASSARRACGEPSPGRAACLAMRLQPASAPAASTAASPAVSSGSGAPAKERAEPWPGFLTPALLHAAYELPDETPQATAQTIAVVDAYDDPTAESDLAVFDKEFGLPSCTAENGCFRKVNEKGEASPLPKTQGEWASEISIDVQVAHTICQNCKVLLVEAKSEDFSDLGAGVAAAAKLGATEISNSYGGPEESADTSLVSSYYDQPGVVVTASSGDCGYISSACRGRAQRPEFPASSSDVVAVGGTSLTESGGTWTSEAWSEGGSGCSEVFTAPLWQSGTAGFAATGCAGGRAVADVAAIGDPETGVDIYDSTPEKAGEETGWGVWGGTSVASPIVASEFALAGGAHSVSYPAATLYQHAGEAADLYDVTLGSNGKCGTRTICNAAAGYDGPTGLGSPLGLGAFAPSGAPQNIEAPGISGYAEEGDTLTESRGSWNGGPTEFSYLWETCASEEGCQAIPGATSQTLLVPADTAGETIRVRETATNTAGSGSAVSSPVGPVVSAKPTVSAVSPLSAPTGSTLTVHGSALDQVTSVTVANLAASFTLVSPTELTVTVPNGAWKGKVAVTSPHGSASFKKTFAANFTIRSFSPSSGGAGTTVTIKGTGFERSSQVSFDGTPATVLAATPKKIKVDVPAGAGAGPISVTNTAAPAGTIYSAASFTP